MSRFRTGPSAWFGVPIVLGAIVMLSSIRPSEGIADAILTAPMSATFEPEKCAHHCRSCGEDKHDIVTHATTNNHKSSHLENRNTGSCDLHACDSQLLTLRVANLWNKIQAADPEKVAQLLIGNRDIAHYNEERSAVQFRCSQGKVIASLPLQVEQQALAE